MNLPPMIIEKVILTSSPHHASPDRYLQYRSQVNGAVDLPPSSAEFCQREGRKTCIVLPLAGAGRHSGGLCLDEGIWENQCIAQLDKAQVDMWCKVHRSGIIVPDPKRSPQSLLCPQISTSISEAWNGLRDLTTGLIPSTESENMVMKYLGQKVRWPEQ